MESPTGFCMSFFFCQQLQQNMVSATTAFNLDSWQANVKLQFDIISHNMLYIEMDETTSFYFTYTHHMYFTFKWMKPHSFTSHMCFNI